MAQEVTLEIYHLEGKTREVINGKLDIYKSDNLPLSLQFGIKNISNLSESTGSYSKTFDVPATKHNNKLLQHAIRDQLDPSAVTKWLDTTVKCRVSVNGRILMTGSFTIKSYTKNAKEKAYKITLLGDNNNWVSIMDGRMMCETTEPELNQVHDWHNGLWHWYNANRKVDDVNYPVGMPTYDICIPIIAWGTYMYDHVPANWKQMRLEEQTPAFFIKKLVNAFFQEAGYNVNSNFMNTKFFKKLVMPTDPSRFNHGNFSTLGGGTNLTTVCVAEAEFFNDTGAGHGVDTMCTCQSCTWQMPHTFKKWDPCLLIWDFPYGGPYNATWGSCPQNGPYAVYNHCAGTMEVKWGWSPPAADDWIANRFARYNEEKCDLYGKQQVAEWQCEPDTNWSDQSQEDKASSAAGYPVGMYNVYPMKYHFWDCPITATYTIEVKTSVAMFKSSTANSNGKGKVQIKLKMIENASGWNLTDNSMMQNAYASTPGTETDLDSETVTTPNGSAGGGGGGGTFNHWHYRESDILWTGVVPAGARIVVEWRNIRHNNTDNNGHGWDAKGIILDREFAKWDAGYPFASSHNNMLYGTTARPTTFKITTGTEINIGDEVTWHEYLPCDITMKSFIAGLTGLFNLYWYTDEVSKTVYVEPYDEFYGLKIDAVDWTKKLDLNRASETKFITDMIARNALYKYLDPSKDEYLNYENSLLDYPHHSQFVDLGAAFLNQLKTYGTSLFGATWMIHDNQLVDLIDPDTPWIPLIIGEYVADVETTPKPEVGGGYLPRILSYEGMQPTGTQSAWGGWANSGAGSDTDIYPRAISFVDNITPTTGQEHANLAYHDNPYTGQSGLYSKFFEGLLQDLIALPRMRIAYFYLTPRDIAELDLRNLVWLKGDGDGNGTYWKIHKIVDYKPHLDTVTKVELLQYQIRDNSAPKPKKPPGPPKDPKVFDTKKRTDGVVTFNTGNKKFNADKRSASNEGGQSVSAVMRGNKAPSNNGNVVMGNNLVTRTPNQIVLGQYNKEDKDAILIVGGGVDESTRRNVLTVKADGSMYLGSDSDNLMTKDSSGQYIDLYTKESDRIIKLK